MIKWFTTLTEILGWLQIVASPALAGIAIGAIVYVPHPTTPRLIIGIAITLLGLLIGIRWATNIYKSKRGTIAFLSRISATPELDETNEKQNQQYANRDAEV